MFTGTLTTQEIMTNPALHKERSRMAREMDNNANVMRSHDGESHSLAVTKDGHLRSYEKELVTIDIKLLHEVINKVLGFIVKIFRLISGISFNKCKIANALFRLQKIEVYQESDKKVYLYGKHEAFEYTPTKSQKNLVEHTMAALEQIFPGYTEAHKKELHPNRFIGDVEYAEEQREIEMRREIDQSGRDFRSTDAYIQELLAINRAAGKEMDEKIHEMQLAANARLKTNSEFTTLETSHDIIRGQRELDASVREDREAKAAEITALEEKIASRKAAEIKAQYYAKGEEIDPAEDDDIFDTVEKAPVRAGSPRGHAELADMLEAEDAAIAKGPLHVSSLDEISRSGVAY